MNDAFLRAIAAGSYWISAHEIGAHDADGVTSPSALAAEVLRLRGLVADATWHDGELQRQAARAVEAERQRDEAYKHIAELDALVPCDDYQAPPLRTMTSPERQKVAGWAIATCARVMRGELDAFPEDTRNRLTIGVVWDDERWSLTLARGDYEHAVEAQRNEARAERDRARRAALRWEGSADEMERERDSAQARERVTMAVLDEVRTILGVPDGADVLTHARRVVTERDEAQQPLRPGSAVARPDEWDKLRMEADQCRRERDAHAARNRGATQQIVEAIGSVGPESVEDAVPRVLAKLAEARTERDEARRAALRWEGHADAAERETATHRRAAEVCIAELAEAQQSLRERTAEREALIERVSDLEATASAGAVAAIREAEERGARWALDYAHAEGWLHFIKDATWDRLAVAFADTAAAAEAYARRVRAEALEAAADMCDASTVNGDVDCSIAERLRARAADERGGR